MNKVILHGRLGADVEVKTTQSGVSIASLNIATDESYNDKSGNKIDRTEWHKVIFFGSVTATLSKYFHKGDGIIIEGKLSTRSWETEKGEKRYATEIIGNSFEFPINKKPTAHKAHPGDYNQDDDLPY